MTPQTETIRSVRRIALTGSRDRLAKHMLNEPSNVRWRQPTPEKRPRRFGATRPLRLVIALRRRCPQSQGARGPFGQPAHMPCLSYEEEEEEFESLTRPSHRLHSKAQSGRGEGFGGGNKLYCVHSC